MVWCGALMIHFNWFRFRLGLLHIPVAFRIQRRDDRHQNRGDNHAGRNQRRRGSGHRFEGRVNLGNNHRVGDGSACG